MNRFSKAEFTPKFTFCNSSENASHISNLSFVDGGTHLLAFFMNEQIMYVARDCLHKLC